MLPPVEPRLLIEASEASEVLKRLEEEAAEMPSAATTVTSTVPAGCGGDRTVNWVSLLMMKLNTGTLPKSTS